MGEEGKTTLRRADRLYALVEELRSRSPRAVGRDVLATRLEVTPRTVERDILALQQAGVPIWSQRGRGGGYALDRAWTVPPLNFDATEALAVLMALAGTRHAPFGEAGRRAEQKLLAAMVPAEAERTRQLASRIRYEPPRSNARGVVRAIEHAVVERRVVEIKHRGRDGITSRTVEAHGLQVTSEASYLVGWCRLRDAGRTFRVDRILSVRLLGEVAPPRPLDEMIGWVDNNVTPGDDIEGSRMPTRPTTARRGGPPRKVDHVTGSHTAYAAAIARSLPGTIEAKRKRTTTFAVNDRVFLELGDENQATAKTSDEDYHLVLTKVSRDDVRALIEDAWASHAHNRSVAAYRKARAAWEAKPPLTEDDIRRAVLALPGANWGPIWGSEPGFRFGDQKKGRFARFGPPEGTRVSNLLAPDDEHALVIFHCDAKPALLASAAGRYFTTPHYGAPDEPGTVIVRLTELRHDDLPEIAELLEDAWAVVAPPDVVTGPRATEGTATSRTRG